MAKAAVPRRRRPVAQEERAAAGLRDAFVEALAQDYALHGAAAIATLRTEKPVDYVKLVASLLPRQGSTDAEGGEDGGEPIAIEVRFVSSGG